MLPAFEGAATRGIEDDYSVPTDYATYVPPGTSSADITIMLEPKVDGVAEGNETILIGVDHFISSGGITTVPLRGFTVVPDVIVLVDIDDADPVIAGAESATMVVTENTDSGTDFGAAFTPTDAEIPVQPRRNWRI